MKSNFLYPKSQTLSRLSFQILSSKHNSSPIQYSVYQINSLVKHTKQHYTSLFKESLIYSDNNDYIVVYYSLNVSRRLILINKHTIMNLPQIHFTSETVRRLMFKHIHSKRRAFYSFCRQKKKKSHVQQYSYILPLNIEPDTTKNALHNKNNNYILTTENTIYNNNINNDLSYSIDLNINANYDYQYLNKYKEFLNTSSSFSMGLVPKNNNIKLKQSESNINTNNKSNNNMIIQHKQNKHILKKTQSNKHRHIQRYIENNFTNVFPKRNNKSKSNINTSSSKTSVNNINIMNTKDKQINTKQDKTILKHNKLLLSFNNELKHIHTQHNYKLNDKYSTGNIKSIVICNSNSNIKMTNTTQSNVQMYSTNTSTPTKNKICSYSKHNVNNKMVKTNPYLQFHTMITKSESKNLKMQSKTKKLERRCSYNSSTNIKKNLFSSSSLGRNEMMMQIDSNSSKYKYLSKFSFNKNLLNGISSTVNSQLFNKLSNNKKKGFCQLAFT